jgi:hypothetical protein
MRNLLVLVVVKASPVFEPTVNPENVIAPALAPSVTRMSIALSTDGAARVNAPLLVRY